MRAWRIVHAHHGADALSGEGARLFGGRWNNKGRSLVYCAESLALAALEVLVHADAVDLPADMVQIAVEIPDRVPVRAFERTELPAGWSSAAGPAALKRLGDSWIEEAREAVLLVPSAVVPEERLVLINPDHPEASKIKAGPPKPFRFDPRLRQ